MPFRFPFIKAQVNRIVINTGGFDSDAADFFTRASITDSTQKNAVNNMVLSLKSNSLWTLMKCIYPFVGGTSSTHSHNLRSSSFQITWSGSPTHNSNGVTGNGSDGKGAISFQMSSDRSSADAFAWGVYSRTSGQEAIASISGTVTEYSIWPRYTDNTTYWYDSRLAALASGSNTDGQGFYVGSRTSSSDQRVYKNGSQLGSTGTTNAIIVSSTVELLHDAFGGWSSRNLALAFIYDGGLDSSQVSTLNTIIETFEDALSRGVQ